MAYISLETNMHCWIPLQHLHRSVFLSTLHRVLCTPSRVGSTPAAKPSIHNTIKQMFVPLTT